MDSDRNVLFLDLATTTGWSLLSGEIIRCGVWQLGRVTNEWNGDRLVRLWHHLNDFDDEVDHIVYERTRLLQGRAANLLPTLRGVVELWARLHGIAYEGEEPSTIKKHATGSGKANKKQMMQAAAEKWPHLLIANHDAADALWMMDLWRSKNS